jgi:hypothetical protein
VIRSDASEAHRLSLSARVVSAQHSQVKAKTAVAKALLAHFEITPKQLSKHSEIATVATRMQHRRLNAAPISAPDAGTFSSNLGLNGNQRRLCQRIGETLSGESPNLRQV